MGFALRFDRGKKNTHRAKIKDLHTQPQISEPTQPHVSRNRRGERVGGPYEIVCAFRAAPSRPVMLLIGKDARLPSSWLRNSFKNSSPVFGWERACFSLLRFF